MLPDPYDKPPGRSEQAISLSVAVAIASDLREPVRGVRLRHRAVLGAAVPEAAVEEYRDAGPRERDIGTDRPSTRHRNWEVDAEAKTMTMERGPEPQLGSAVAPAVGRHDAPPIRRHSRPRFATFQCLVRHEVRLAASSQGADLSSLVPAATDCGLAIGGTCLIDDAAQVYRDDRAPIVDLPRQLFRSSRDRVPLYALRVDDDPEPPRRVEKELLERPAQVAPRRLSPLRTRRLPQPGVCGKLGGIELLEPALLAQVPLLGPRLTLGRRGPADIAELVGGEHSSPSIRPEYDIAYVS